MIPARLDAAYVFVSSVAAGSTGGSVTTAAANTTGADTIFCYVGEAEAAADTTLSDSKSNAWQTDVTQQADTVALGILGRLFYCKNCTVGAGHTFTVTDNGSTPKPSVACAVFSGGHLTNPLDQQTGTVDIDAGLSNTTGSITPSADDEIVITGLAFGGGASATITIGSSYTITDQVDVASDHRGVALAYKIQTTATATNPTWTYTTNQYVVTTIASFKVFGGAAPGWPQGSQQLLIR